MDPALLGRMGAALRHRGPDDEGQVIFATAAASIGLGHQRLSIIDLSPAGRQPMSNEDETVWVTFNGEIYNFQELRDGLRKRGIVSFQLRHRSHRSSLRRIRSRCLDHRWHVCFCALGLQARISSSGARPDWQETIALLLHPGLAFASEIKALLQHPQVDRDFDCNALNKYLAFEYVPAPQTIFKSVKKLEPGHYLVCRNGTVEITQYWDLPIDDQAVSARMSRRLSRTEPPA